ncbi:protein kinase domain-containing protein [Nannocystis bainbridge]|uniref:Protein kinase n=1 Tax=Nannocystis bainbridge TaxID=2995303 RepID=A0ABT5DXI6_9BACT|nr:protein kinase [Nannocystis bainbridge]MDC0717438.1 protein kinase [Nannocystis bainbridge]
MTVDNPYRAAGAFAGKAYIRRGADAELVEQIRDNQYYPYFAAPRQSGKSSLIARTMASLPAPEFRCALVDLSPFVVRSYDDFWRQFLHEVARSANFDPAPIGKGEPRDVFKAWLTAYPGRLIIFVDEIDVLLHVECREQIFSKIRTFFNLRAHEEALLRLTFVLAGAAHSSRFISDPRWSPFNVAIEIALEDLSTAQVSQLASYLATAGAFAGPDLVGRVFELTGGSVFLCQLVFEALWSRAARGAKKLDASDVDAVVATIVAESPRNIHFYNIFRLVTQDSRLAMLFRRLVDGEELGEADRQELQLTGLCRGMDPFRNEVYARVFGTGGPLDLKVAGAKATLGRKLEVALTKRQQLSDEGGATTEVEIEIAALKREFREGAQLREGDVLGRGRYRLIAQIGQGGFATVWHARDERNQREVALKVLHGQFAEDKTRRDRFFRGAWKMSELQHPAIVQVLEPYGEEAGRHFFVMEYMAGGTLHEAVLDRKLTHDQVVAGIVAVGQALVHAHARGLVHRDVKPSNVLLGDVGAAKLTDFDLVREQDSPGSTRTGPMGSFIYAAPEVLNRPQDADHRADIYGLAMTAVFGLHGAELPLEVVRDADRFIDRLHCGGLLKDVLKKGVAWEIERRFTSAAEFTQALATAWADSEERSPAPPPKQQEMAPTWTAMFATLPLPESGPLAAAGPVTPARAQGAPPPVKSAPLARPREIAASTSPPPVAAGPMAAAPMKPGRVEKAELEPEARSEAMRPERPERAELAARKEAARRAWQAELDDDDARTNEETLTTAALSATAVQATAAEMARDELTVTGAEIEAPERILHAPTGAARMHEQTLAQARAPSPHERASTQSQVTPPSVPIAAAPGRGVYALLGLCASAALILLVLQLAGPSLREAAQDGERGANDARGLTEIESEGKRDVPDREPAKQDDPRFETKDPAPPLATVTNATSTPAGDKPPEQATAGAEASDTTAGTTTGGPEHDLPDESGTAGKATGATTAKPIDKPPQSPNVGQKRKKTIEERIDEGCFQVRARDAEAGAKILQAVLAEKPFQVEALRCLAQGLKTIGDFPQSEVYFEQLMAATNERNLTALLGLAQVNEAMTRYDRAADYYQRVLKIDPDNKSAQAFLGSKNGASAPAPAPPAGMFRLKR